MDGLCVWYTRSFPGVITACRYCRLGHGTWLRAIRHRRSQQFPDLAYQLYRLVLCPGLVLAADLTQRALSQNTPVVMARNVITPWLTLLAGLAVTILAWHMISS